MSLRLAAALAGLAFAALGCGELVEVQSNVCGNRVVEQGETCDGEPKGACLPPGSAGQCHFDCTIREDGTRPECPPGSGCDSTGVCRVATGGYVARSSTIADNATSVVAADFDGDGRAEVLSEEAISVIGVTKFRVHYFDREGAVTQSWNSARAAISLAVGQVSDDLNFDVVLSDGRIGVLLGQSDHTLISETYPSYFLPDTRIRVAGPILDAPIDESAPLVIVSEHSDSVVLRHPDNLTSSLLATATLPVQHIDELAGEPVSAKLFDADAGDPCREVAIAERGANEIHVYSLCTQSAGAIGWLEAARDRVIALDPPASITAGPRVADVDGNGHLDLVVGTEQHAYVAYGDGHVFAAAQPWIVTVRSGMDSAPNPIDLPLAMGDVSGDGLADLVSPSALLISQRGLDGTLEYRGVNHSFGVLWTAARIADFNANGMPDVVAVSDTKLDIDFYNGTGHDVLNPSVIPTQRPVQQLAVGDFDGDLIQDLAYTQSAGPAELSEVSVSFGNPAGPPMPGITAARAPGLVQIGALEFEFDDRASELFLVYEQPESQAVAGASFAWLSGFSRRLLCLVELNRFVEGSQIDSMNSLVLALGAFTSSGGRDAIVLAWRELTSELAIWIAPDLASRTSQPKYLGWNLDPESKPIRVAVNGEDAQLDVLMGAGDLDGDGTDELVFAAPTEDRSSCRVSIVQVRPDDAEPLRSEVALDLELPCSQARGGQLAIEDLDGDAALDLAFLLGFRDGARALTVFWNDGSGHFSKDESTDLARDGDQPAAFAFYRPTPGDRLRLAYVTADRLRIFQARTGRTFEAATGVAGDVELRDATGIAAGDVDGDQIADLVIAESGAVVVFRAQLRP